MQTTVGSLNIIMLNVGGQFQYVEEAAGLCKHSLRRELRACNSSTGDDKQRK